MKLRVVIGIPFCNEKDILADVLKGVDEGLDNLQNPHKTLIICVGDPSGAETLESIRRQDLKASHLEFLMKPGSNGRGAGIRAILEIANMIEADAVIFAADLLLTGDTKLRNIILSKSTDFCNTL